MTTYLVMKHKCTFNTYTETSNAAGQKVYSATPSVTKTVRCQFLYLATDNKTTPVEENEDIIEILVGDDIAPTYKQQIVNIKNKYGTIIEAGPLEIIGIKKYAGYGGKLHHYRLRTRKMNSC